MKQSYVRSRAERRSQRNEKNSLPITKSSKDEDHRLCAVTVTEGDFQFSLESVRALGTLMTGDDASAEQELRLVEAKAAAVCSHPGLPEDFKPLCLRKDAGASLARLALVATHSDACEICESVACTGC